MGLQVFSVLPEGDGFLFDAFLRDDADTKGISSVNISLCSGDEDVRHQLNCLLLSQGNVLNTLHVFETNLWKSKHGCTCI